MRFGSRAESFAKAFALVMSTGLSFGIVPSLIADESIPSIKLPSSAGLNQLFSKQWVCLGQDNSISGNLVQLTDNEKAPLAGLPVALVSNGEVAYYATADETGAFKFENMKTGSYSLITRTNESIAAFSLQVLDASNNHLTSSVEVRVVRPAGLKVKEILRSQTVPSLTVRSESPKVSVDPLGESRSFGETHFVKLDAKGRLSGQLGSVLKTTDMSEMVVYVLRNGEEVSRAKADKNGNFSFDGLRPGVYGFVAAGSSGFAATSFQLVGSEIASVGNDGNRFVSSNGNVFLGHACRKMNVEVVPCCEVTVCEQPVQTIVQEPCAVPVDKCGTAPTCGCGGGFGGGGGGGGGIGGLGGLAAIGGLIAVGAIAASDNNNNAPIVSPVTP